jgi:NADH:ubiquinone oxidoreductase subunit F (NADH-binding)
MGQSDSQARPAEALIPPPVDAWGPDPDELRTLLQARGEPLTPAAVRDVARKARVPERYAARVAAFYGLLEPPEPSGKTLRVCQGLACWLHGASQAERALESEFGKGWTIDWTGCLGICDRAPAFLFDGQAGGPLLMPDSLVERGLWRGEARTYVRPRRGETRRLLARAGQIDPESFESARAHGAYCGLERALSLSPEAVLLELEAAGLSLSGGGPVGPAWTQVAQAAGGPAYIVGNASEPEPLTLKQRVLLELDPHLVLEGLALAAYATGARAGTVFVRAEYAPQADQLERAIEQAQAHNWLGEHIGGTEFSLRLQVHRAPAAYRYQDPAALLAALEGQAMSLPAGAPNGGLPRYRGRPALVAEVETLAAAAGILVNGAEWYRSVGTRGCPGTRLYTLLGMVNHPGVFEAPSGLTLRQIIEDFGDGMRPGSTLQAVLVGGMAGVLAPPELLDQAIADEASSGLALGSGACLVCDQSIPPLWLLREVMRYFEHEAATHEGRCWVGLRAVRARLDRLIAEPELPGDLDELAALAGWLQRESRCCLGQAAAWPLVSALQNFGPALLARRSAC